MDLCPHPVQVQTPSLTLAVGSVGTPCPRGGKAGGLGRRWWLRLDPPQVPPFPGRAYPGPALMRGVVMSPQVSKPSVPGQAWGNPLCYLTGMTSRQLCSYPSKFPSVELAAEAYCPPRPRCSPCRGPYPRGTALQADLLARQ